MKKSLKAILFVLIAIILFLGFLTYTQWNTITAFVDSLRYSQEDLDRNLAKDKETIQNFIDNEKDVSVRDLTEEESEALRKGELTESEIIDILTKPQHNPSSGSEQKGNSKNEAENPMQKPSANANEPAENSSGQRISEAIARLYIQKSKYLGNLDSIEAEARQEFINMTPEQKKTGKRTMLPKYLPRVAAWESECDAVVYGIIDEIAAELRETGKDMTLVEELKSTYLNEKKAKKTYFINRYMD